MKKRFLCQNLPSPSTSVFLNESEAKHALKVLRLQDGAIVEAIDGKGNGAKVILHTRGGPHFEFLEAIESSSTPASHPLPLTLEISVLKGQAMEWVVEKCVELGVQELTPVVTDHTVVQLDKKGPEVFQARWQKIADQALKQCGRLKPLQIHLPIALNRLVNRPSSSALLRIWCDETAITENSLNAPYIMNWAYSFHNAKSSIPASSLRILIGPEGGWSSMERSLLAQTSHCQRVHLGPYILRAETAAVFATSLLSAQLRCMDYSSF